MMKSKKQKGFSLVELLIVVTIIGIIASIAIPNLYASRRAANEASAISSMRVISTGQITYQTTIGQGQFGSFASLYNQRIIDPVLGTSPNIKSGYLFTMAVSGTGSSAYYDLTSVPQYSGGVLASTGRRNFYTNESHVIYFSVLPATEPTCDSARTVTGGIPLRVTD